MLKHQVIGSDIFIETEHYKATIATEGYTSGVKSNTFLDKKTKAHDLGFGLSIVDFLLEPASAGAKVEAGQYEMGPEHPYHGNIRKRYVEGPQICTQAKKLPFEIIRGSGFLAVKQWYKYHKAYPPYQAGSRWEQTLIFPEKTRYFLSADRITSVNDHPALILRIDMPGHLKHQKADSFEEVYTSYQGRLPAAEFSKGSFPPDAKFLYQRNPAKITERIIRGYRVKQDGKPGPWLLGMTLAPGDVYEGWTHERGYICFIEEIGGRPVKAGGTFGACYCVGWFDHIEQAEAVYEMYRGWSGIKLLGPPEHPTGFAGLKQDELPPVRAIDRNPIA